MQLPDLHFPCFSDMYTASAISVTTGGQQVENNQSGIGTGTILLSFITGLAAGIAAALLIDARKAKTLVSDDQEDQLFI